MELSRSYREVSIAKWPRWIEQLLRIYRAYKNFLDRSRSCRTAIKIESQESRWIEIAITAIKKRSSRGSIDSLAVKRYREAVEIAKKQFFKEEKNTDMNAIKHATQPKIQTTFWAPKSSLNKKNVKHLDSKHTHTHTHTHKNKSNQFYISKTS